RWRGIPLAHYIIYELHPGTFTAPGTFDAAIERLKDLVDLGITAVELMPVAQFPGERNWGYDGVFPFAVQNSYGGPTGLKRFIDACHGRGLAVILDVVYNHLGPEGNYLGDFGPYFSDLYRTPWGAPLNFDGPDSDAVRRFFIENALAWIAECHVDALRLDAVHAILDFSAQPFLQDLAEAAALFADATGRRIHLIAESALNDTRLIRPPQLGGLGLDAQWNDDLHHSLHALLTGERRGYYCDFGGFDQLLKALREGFVYDGRYSAYRRRRHGSSSRSIPSHRLVVFAQNHDQVGNRLHGDRLSRILPFEALKLAAGIVLLAPQLPLIFMGEEYGETAPFPYFVSHSDPELIAAVRRGRREEFASFGWEGEPPDPQAEATFTSARLTPSQRLAPGPHRHLWEFHRRLIALRRSRRALQSPEPSSLEVLQAGGRVGLIRRRREEEICVVFHAGAEPVSARVPLPAGRWRKRLDSAEPQWGGPGSRLPDYGTAAVCVSGLGPRSGRKGVSMEKYICIHGHFYQPPRENAWLEAVELQDSAYPYHDWNERVTAQCYATMATSRLLDEKGLIRGITNNYARISFNFGPTLLTWLERHAPAVYVAILDADRESRARFSGHGAAIAQAYNHIIMPLANRRDKETQVRWGLRDFERRFGRPPEGMWLPETAADLATLEILAAHGIAFTILSPRQARRVRRHGAGDWQEVGGGRIDPSRPYRVALPSGRSLTLFFYDDPISRAVAFEGLLADGLRFADRLMDGFDETRQDSQLVHIATDGESYGHHFHKGNMALAAALDAIGDRQPARLTVYGEYLERHPPEWEVEIHENSSWSCVHGIERWRSDCGCNSGGRPGWRQAWRAPLREALDWLRDALCPAYEEAMAPLGLDPWGARDAYIGVIHDRETASVDAFFAAQCGRPLTPDEKIRALQLLELQRHALLMYTSCGWFFDELSGLETVQVIQRVREPVHGAPGKGAEQYPRPPERPPDL
ncbi:MAG: malto-oligosyltrehalose trehalohydrolase, partial [Desulfobacterales bacterium]|nr:malto-oligosyltrehalose trehalohydrolase [Desulfobacterales bacterium]